MVTWRDRRGVATFRGVPFTVDEHSAQGGRRAVLTEIPGSDRPPSSEDLGQAPREWTIRGHVVGADYEDQRDALIAALEAEGPGELVHPYHGTRTVVIPAGGYRVTQSSRLGGLAEFEITCHEVAETLTPSATVDSSAALSAAATATQDTITSTFLATYQPLTSGSESTVDAVAGMCASATRAISTAPVTGAALAEVRARITALLTDAAPLTLDPPALVAEMEGLVEAIATGIRAAGVTQVAARLLGLYSADLGARPSGTTPTRIQEQANYDAVAQVYRGTVIARAAAEAVDDEWEAYEDAIAVRDQVLEVLDEHLDQAVDDDYEALTDLRTALITAVPPPEEGLPHVRTVDLPATLPSLVVAQRVYGDATRAEEIELRNGVADPLLVIGQGIKVLV